MDNHHVDDVPSVALIHRNNKYELQERVRLRNDLLLIIGYLEFFNALDFPANVWNTIPVPTFAVGLMATGGSIALLSSGFAFLDFRRSWRNIKLLRKERTYLQEQYSKAPITSPRRRHVQAWLSLNYRELGWELIDRSLMDAMVGFAAILIGVGTLMAIGGANPHVYLASNLLSGYIGNSFIAAYSLANVSWSVYLYIRARRHKRFFRQGTADRTIRARADCIFRNHQIYAVVNAVTLLVSGAGSLVSATMWYGYVIIIPTIFFSVFCNIFWRRRVGYNRILTQFRTQEAFSFDFYRHIEDAVSIQDQIKSEKIGESLKLLPPSQLLQFVVDNEMLEDLALYIANDDSLLKALLGRTSDSTLVLSTPMLEIMDRKALVNAVQAVAESQCPGRALDRERMLFELLGAYWHAEEKELADSQRRRSIEAAASVESKSIEVDSEESGSGEEETPCHSAQDRAQEHQSDIEVEKASNH